MVLRHSIRIFACLVALVIPSVLFGAARVLETRPVPSPDKRFLANVEWDDVGFIGLLRMRVYLPNGDPYVTVELPEINPSPANLAWLNDEWVSCESFIGDRGSGFFYVHVPSKRAYLIEIVAPKPESDWILSFTTNDSVSSAAIRTISRGRDSLFPILLRDLPTDGADYFDAEFAENLRASVDQFSQYRKQAKFRKFELLSDADIHTSVGAVTVANFDGQADVVYFPAGTTTPLEMLAKVKRQPLSAASQLLINGINPPTPEPRWKDASGAFQIRGTYRDESTAPLMLMTGEFLNVSDHPFTPPVEEETSVSSTKGKGKVEDAKGKKPSPSAKGKSAASSKSPSRAE